MEEYNYKYDVRDRINAEPPKSDALDKLKLKLRLKELKLRAKLYKEMAPNDAALMASIDMCLDAPKKVQAEYDKITKAVARAKKTNPDDSKTKLRIDYLNYQGWFTEQHARRAAIEAARRKEHLLNVLKSPDRQREEMRKCKEDILYWFDNYAWIVDPRNNILFAFPFELFKFQRESVEWIHSLIYTERSDGLIDKSRDMGVTWLIVCMFLYYWLFPSEGAQFHALITSYREDEVDKQGVPGTIFEKIRSQIRLLPSWMLPEGFKMRGGGGRDEGHCTHMKVYNPQNNSTIVGTTANAETGRSGRYTVIFFDEMASIREDVSSAAAASQSTNTRLFVSTPKGKLNYFAQLRFGGEMPCLSFHWPNHPLKDTRWYEGQKLKMSKEMVGQELDIDYDASQPGKVYPQYDEKYHVITKSEFMREIPGATRVDENGRRHFKIPSSWNLGRSHDWGSSDSAGEHSNITMWFATAKEGIRTNTHKIDLRGAVFIYRMYTAPPHSTVRQVAHKVKELQFPDREQDRMTDELMSHEALSERDTYEQEHGLYYQAWDTDYNGGIAQVRDYLEVQWMHQPHPFRLEKENGKPMLKGRPMMYIIVDDEQGECFFDNYTNKLQVRQPKDDDGMARLRAEFGVYHYPQSEVGKAVRRQRPEKMFDDAMDCLRCMAVTFPPVAQYTMPEQIEMSLPPALRIEAGLLEPDPEEKARIWLARQSYLNEQRILKRLKDNNGNILSRRGRVLQRAMSGK